MPAPLPEALHTATVLEAAFRYSEAAQLYADQLPFNPSIPELHYLLGHALYKSGTPATACAPLQTALSLKPDFPEAWNCLGLSQRSLGDLDSALASFAQAARHPNELEYLCNLADTLLQVGRSAAAIEAYHVVLALDPDNVPALVNLSAALLATGGYAEAEQLSRRALALAPQSLNALNNLANALAEESRPLEAIELYRSSLTLRPDHPETLCNLGNAYIKLNRLPEALQCFRDAQRLAPDLHEAIFSEGLVWLRLGNFPEGWWRYEHRLLSKTIVPVPSYPQPFLRTSDDLQGKTLFVHADQGLGDDVQFLRFIPALHARGATILLELPATLVPLAQASFPYARVFAEATPPGPFDFHCLLMSLPYILGLKDESELGPFEYLKVFPLRLAHWRDRLSAQPGPRIGVVWAGSPKNLMDTRRSISLQQLRTVFDEFQGSVYSLQKEIPPLDSTDFAQWPSLHTVITPDVDFAELAAILSSLDLVIAVDTSVAHLAAALGRPTWLLLAHAPDWRWLQDRTDTAWYPSMRLFRQPSPGDWPSVLQSVSAVLAKQF